MSKWKLVKLDFKNNPAHFGELGIGMEETSERVRSDTLFSALVISYARIGKNVDTLLRRFHQEEVPFRLSSSFIYREQDGKTTYFLPRPKYPPTNYPTGDDLKIAKDYKKLNFLDLETWKNWYQNGSFNKDAELPENFYSKCFDIDKQPKIAIDRNTRATNLYHTSFVRYRSKSNDKSGLYFLIEFNDESLENDLNDLKAALELLGEEGLGGEKSSGAGQFEASWHDLDEIWKELIKFDGNFQSLISLYWDDELISLDNSSYELQERGGWITSSSKNQRRKKVVMFAEGSVFSEIPKGKLANVTPPEFSQHKIYRSGIAVSLPIKIDLKGT
ncbi:MAG: type III-A CRISPR-associated RAMP protein Csm4 [Pseudanabaena sp.]|jgi:CRISPR-associated protein Csm4|uniref:type III-A CRISPR-associated RAMP protein Csm4 n=1 Tax=Pseudanabaena mucicola TaxID=71190 RepID=UPI0025783949|nr:type III-A CRISPR-associated RAMP protein Csm4 [Pseudanabaena mucicola]MCA6572002.1 type III-A CRISPR-associated RAMP protein Csm4 [Pseudanabaena sp. M53BS1SP1A06MG]MCA6584633.1 type III-A CRISPR-associated RAMP protein Csm4 [Pseudanabaena sp. M34BS1SP1A06MG]MCA6591126.1 type III-A CRISPR-associated RAMP protein Csm4 [Pseudanabaena sp. M38BS1SP1A06MG]MCA6600170.1 type III-A CRISPR-associated RAMP protein Csm4 [Pseudanabaena sp. M57BS1SP1A06MG]MCA6623629.1 type III-A CRISPR-associated RAMP p